MLGMAESLRTRQKQMARELILQAFAAEVVEHGVTNISLQAVAARAGVSNRTLYNYFESRDRLVEGLNARVEQLTVELGGHVMPEDCRRIGEYVAINYRVWDELGDLMRAVVQIDAVSAAEGQPNAAGDGRRSQRLQAIDQDLRSLRPDLTPQQARTITHALRTLTSSRTWHRLTVEDGVDTETASTVVKWAWDTLRDAVADGHGPFDQSELDGDTPPPTTSKQPAPKRRPPKKRPAKGRTP
jgi:AcrR family transcriptional regulator